MPFAAAATSRAAQAVPLTLGPASIKLRGHTYYTGILALDSRAKLKDTNDNIYLNICEQRAARQPVVCRTAS